MLLAGLPLLTVLLAGILPLLACMLTLSLPDFLLVLDQHSKDTHDTSMVVTAGLEDAVCDLHRRGVPVLLTQSTHRGHGSIKSWIKQLLLTPSPGMSTLLWLATPLLLAALLLDSFQSAQPRPLLLACFHVPLALALPFCPDSRFVW